MWENNNLDLDEISVPEQWHSTRTLYYNTPFQMHIMYAEDVWYSRQAINCAPLRLHRAPFVQQFSGEVHGN